MKLQALIEQRANTVAGMRAIMDKAEAEKRDLTADEDKTFNEQKGAIAALDASIARARQMDDLERGATAVITRKGDGSYEERAHDFSIMRAVAAQLPGSNVDDGLEREISAEVAKRTGKKFQGIAVPDEVFQVRREARSPITIATEASDLKPTQHHGNLYIDMLRANLVTEQLGATVLNLGPGDHDIPRGATAATAEWLSAEDASISESTPTFDDVNLTPKTVAARTSWTRRAMLNASPDLEQLLRRDLASVIAQAIDIKAQVGSGSGGEVSGIVNQTGAQGIDMSTPSWSQVLSFINSVETANALAGSLGWAMNPSAKKTLMSTVRVSSTDSVFIMNSVSELAGYRVGVTSQLPGDSGDSPSNGVMIFGNWADLLIGYWSGVDILVNPYEATAYAKGRVLIRAMRDVDVAVRHGESFAYSTNFSGS